jgi:hypothetical protein
LEDLDLLMQYLLGGLSEPERERLEHAYFTNDEASDALDEAENDLIDSYVCNALPPDQRDKFENYFLKLPGKPQRVEFARMLMNEAKSVKIVLNPAQTGQDLGRFKQQRLLFKDGPLYLVATVAAVVAIFMAVQDYRLREELNKAETARTQSQDRIQQLEHQIASLSSHNATTAEDIHAPFLPSISVPTTYIPLTAQSLRGAGSNRHQVVSLLNLSRSVVLVLMLDRDDYDQYSASFQTVENEELHRTSGLVSQIMKGKKKAVEVRMPSQLLKKGDYVIELFGQTPGDRPELVEFFSLSVRR